MGLIRRGGYVFRTWIGDHGPRHVHVYRDGRLAVQWDLEHNIAVQGKTNRAIRKLIAELQREGRL